MTYPSQNPIAPLAVPLVLNEEATEATGSEDEQDLNPFDPDSQTAHSGRDSDGTPVGRADAEADAERTGADPDAV